MLTYDILLPLPFDRAFTYTSNMPLKKGELVQVPWRQKEMVGVVLSLNNSPPEGVTLKEAKSLELKISSTQLEFLEKVSSYNLMPLGMVLKMMLSGAKFPLDHSPAENEIIVNLPPLNPEQQQGYLTIQPSLAQNKYQAFLLDGVTGSGKTEVYLKAAADQLREGKQVLILLPEIGLTHPFLARFKERFGIKPFVWHSRSTPKEKKIAWQAAFNGQAGVFVGARSALFLPYKSLGLIVVDEEHDSSYKQEEQGLYHARDMAILRANIEAITIILSTATPALESYGNVLLGKFIHIKLRERHGTAELPTIHLVDKRNYKEGILSKPLLDAIAKRLNQREQSLLFLNRRGYAPLTLCKSCGFRFGCPGCSTSLVQHKKGKHSILKCHHCGFQKPLPLKCPECQEDALISFGPGVDKVVEELKSHFPEQEIVALTSDMTAKEQREAWEKIYKDQVPLIVGTQLLAKGHHLPKLTFVGIVDGDIGLLGADLRASERAFQLLQQVAGRAGREEHPGEVYLQTYQPENPLFHYFKTFDRDGFYNYELQARQTLSLPPYGRLASIILSAFRQDVVEKASHQLTKSLRGIQGIEVLGPVEAPLARLQSRYRYRILLKSQKSFGLSSALKHHLKHLNIPATVRVIVDIDPQSFW